MTNPMYTTVNVPAVLSQVTTHYPTSAFAGHFSLLYFSFSYLDILTEFAEFYKAKIVNSIAWIKVVFPSANYKEFEERN